MAKDDRALKRLGGGRWETRDGRFSIEPQSGRWALVDTEAADELGLPLVRGIFDSLNGARDAIDAARIGGPVESPLADELKRVRQAGAAPARDRKRGARSAADDDRPRPDDPEPEPEPEPEPKWLRDLAPKEAERARAIIKTLEAAGIEQAEGAARDEVARGKPAIVRLAIARRLAAIADDAPDARTAVRDAARFLVDGRDRELGVGWRLVDDADRDVGEVVLPD